MDDIILTIIWFYLIFYTPGALTIWNIYNLCGRKRCLPGLASIMTLSIGGFYYWALTDITFETAGEWHEVINTVQLHNSISSEYFLSVAIPYILGILAILVLDFVPVRRLSPVFSAFCVASILLANVVQIVYAIQIAKNVSDIELMLYVYHFNILLLSASAIRHQIKGQLELIKERNITYDNPLLNQLYLWLSSTVHMSTFVFICLIILIVVVDILLILLGQGVDGPVKAFTMTADWTFSTQVPPPPVEYKGHYLCTVAAGGHKEVVKPLRYGKRRGAIIIVNRQLCIANAFEDYIQEKMPKFHKGVRTFYDTYGYPVSKHITTPRRADVIYILMKPLEWIFLLFLYTFDTNPEGRIKRQYSL